MPTLQLLYNDYKDRLEFIFVSNERFSEIDKFISLKGYSFELFNSVAKYHNVFNVSSIPRTFLIKMDK